MARTENTVFISYRRTDVYTALAVYENLKNQGYDVFFDYRSISSGDFEQIISSNIRARAHFVLILTPTALDRANEPGDWLRREIEFAIDEKRNIVPLFFRGFRFGDPAVTEKLTGKLKSLSRYNGLNVHEDYFEEAMDRLRTQYLNMPLNTVLHPVSTEVRKVVREEQRAADKALEQIENVHELVKGAEAKFTAPNTQLDSKPIEPPKEVHKEEKKIEGPTPIPSPYTGENRAEGVLQRHLPEQAKLNTRLIRGMAGGLVVIALFIWGVASLLSNLRTVAAEPTETSQPITTRTVRSETTFTPSPPTETAIPPTPALGIGSTIISDKDQMMLLYVPAGEFVMGNDNGEADEKPLHTVYLDAFWIDRTEVTVGMYSLCMESGLCREPVNKTSPTHPDYFENTAEFGDYPVIYIDWNMAKAYCEWVDRRLPTEAEWEKAARGTDGRTYPWGNAEPNANLLNYDNAVGDTIKVGSYPKGASPYGALDMAGNVWEWVADWYSDTYYAHSPESNPPGPNSGESHVLRGGAWRNVVPNVSSAFRIQYPSNETYYNFGFRCAMSATP